MAAAYRVDMNSGVPIYQQLVDTIRAAIKMGTLPSGAQLPTVLQMSEELGLARGTVKRAYDELERLGLVEKIQGRGTFVCYQAPSAAGRKEQAMAAIDAMLDSMGSLGFSMEEAKIFLDLKLRERESHQENLKIGLIECNPEVMEQIDGQLRRIANIDLYPHLLGEVLDYPYQLAEDMDLIITTAVHAEAVEEALGSSKKLARIAIRLTTRSVSQIVKIPAGANVGILCGSMRYGELLRQACDTYTERITLAEPELLGSVSDCKAFLKDKDAVLLPENYEKYCSVKLRQLLKEYSRQHPLILCSYQIDEGSFMYVEEKIQRLWSTQRI